MLRVEGERRRGRPKTVMGGLLEDRFGESGRRVGE